MDRELYRKYGHELFSHLPDDFHVTSKLGRGAYGTAYLMCRRGKRTCSNRRNRRVLKLERNPGHWESTFTKEKLREVDMQREFHHHGLAPKVYDQFFFHAPDGTLYSAILMDYVRILENELKEFPTRVSADKIREYTRHIIRKVKALVNRLCKHGLYHGDMHSGNIAIMGRRFVLIDFGWSFLGSVSCSGCPRCCLKSGKANVNATTGRGCNEVLELSQFVRGLHIDRHKIRNKRMIDELIDRAYVVYAHTAERYGGRVYGESTAELSKAYEAETRKYTIFVD